MKSLKANGTLHTRCQGDRLMGEEKLFDSDRPAANLVSLIFLRQREARYNLVNRIVFEHNDKKANIIKSINQVRI